MHSRPSIHRAGRWAGYFQLKALALVSVCSLLALPLPGFIERYFLTTVPMVDLSSLVCESWGYIGPCRVYRQREACELAALRERYCGEYSGKAQWVRGAQPVRQWQALGADGVSYTASLPGDEHGLLHSRAWRKVLTLLAQPEPQLAGRTLSEEFCAALLDRMCSIGAETRSEEALNDYQRALWERAAALDTGDPAVPLPLSLLLEPADYSAPRAEL